PVDVEEAPVPPGRLVPVEVAPPELGIAPERVLVVGRHVVRDDVEQHAEAGAERERGRELETVDGAPVRAHCVLRSTTTDRPSTGTSPRAGNRSPSAS